MLVDAAVVERAAHLTTREEALCILSTDAPGRSSGSRLEVDGSGVRTSAMHAVHALLADDARRQLLERARNALNRWEAAVKEAGGHPQDIGQRVSRFKARCAKPLPVPAGPPQTQQTDAVHIVERVFNAAQCEQIISAARRAASARGGWDRNRHGRHLLSSGG